jgi:hypothetical protein
MANGTGQSKAPYIIICAGRIDLAAAKNGIERIQAASRAAANLVTYYGDKLTFEDTAPISTVQHAMMEELQTRRRLDVDDLVDEMFVLLDALEQKYS